MGIEIPYQPGEEGLRPSYQDDSKLDDEVVLQWHHYVVVDGKAFPVLFYGLAPGYHSPQYGGHAPVITEPCIWCGRRHQHGDLEGSRVPHCAVPHTHDRTPTGRESRRQDRRICRIRHRDYIILRGEIDR